VLIKTSKNRPKGSKLTGGGKPPDQYINVEGVKPFADGYSDGTRAGQRFGDKMKRAEDSIKERMEKTKAG
jgi:hypothetical protein